MLLQQLEALDLPEAATPLQWIQLRASHAQTYRDGFALVSVHTNACVGEDDLILDGHVMIYSFGTDEDGWYHGDSRLKLSGVGRCDTTGPRQEPDQ
jgi:hypothetical protein